MRIRDPVELRALVAELEETIVRLRAYQNRSFKMQLNPMAHTLQVLAFVADGLEKAASYVRSLGQREKAQFLFDEESERDMFDQLISVQNYVRHRELSDYQREYLAYKESLPTRDLEDVYGLVYIANQTLEILSERVIR